MKRTVWLLGCLIVATVLMAARCDDGPVTNGTPTATPSQPAPKVEVTITSPQKDGPVEMKDSVSGTASGVPDDQRLWAVVRARADTQLHPQPGPIQPDAGGHWSAACTFGQPPHSGVPFTVLIVVAPPAAHQAFLAYLQTAAANNYPGMPSLPPDADTVAAVDVIRR